MAVLVGMYPENAVSNKLPPYQANDKWFYQPFHEQNNTLNPFTSTESIESDLFEEDEIDQFMEGTTSVSAFGEEIEILPAPEGLLSRSVLNDRPETTETIDPTVNIPGTSQKIYKSKLINMLNQDPKLSKDGLTRVRYVYNYPSSCFICICWDHFWGRLYCKTK